ncbi:MAG TPA: hypothetical protein VIP08_14890 [Phenylobacterium sp.]|uniref:hypothetical protein n=1 Tax=Phenylobacterium sp. TaxID=1871053 RepID=UPI002F92FB3E
MRPLMFVVAAAALFTSPAYAQEDHATHQPAAAAEAPAPTHETCRAVMGRQMDGKAVHDHGREKTGAMTWPNGKPLTAAEMERMHKVCAAKLQQTEAPKVK